MKLDIRLENAARRAARNHTNERVRQQLSETLSTFFQSWRRLDNEFACFRALQKFCRELEAVGIYRNAESVMALGNQILFDDYQGRNPAPFSSQVEIVECESSRC